MARFARWPVVLLMALLLPQESAAQPKVVTFSGRIIEASSLKNPGPSDPAIPAVLLSELKATFQFTQYKSLGTITGSTQVGKTWSAPLAATGLSLEATPKAVDGGITVEVRLLRGGSAVVISTLKLAPGGQVLVGGPTTPGGRLILALTGR